MVLPDKRILKKGVEMKKKCIICVKNIFKNEALFQTKDFVVAPSKFPNAPMHTLIILKRHIDFLGMSVVERIRAIALVHAVCGRFKEYGFQSFQVVIFEGKEAGQTIEDHFHVNVVPLKKGDPTPGLRHDGEGRRKVEKTEIRYLKVVFREPLILEI